jgi:hypothetical protein
MVAKAASPGAMRAVERGRGGTPSPSASFVVLPFVNQLRDSRQDYFALNLPLTEPDAPARATNPQARDWIMRGWAWCHRP